jgi:predicted nucleotidyltransferase
LDPELPEESGQRLAAFRELLKRLKDHDVEFIVIGGLAAILQGSPVATYDVDVCAPMSDDNVAKIHRALRDIRPRFRFRPDKLPVPDDPARLRGVRNLNLVTDVGVIDLLGELPGVGTFDQVRNRTEEINLGGFVCRVLDLETLILSKKIAGRDKDLIGVRHLEAILNKRKQEPGLFD